MQLNLLISVRKRYRRYQTVITAGSRSPSPCQRGARRDCQLGPGAAPQAAGNSTIGESLVPLRRAGRRCWRRLSEELLMPDNIGGKKPTAVPSAAAGRIVERLEACGSGPDGHPSHIEYMSAENGPNVSKRKAAHTMQKTDDSSHDAERHRHDELGAAEAGKPAHRHQHGSVQPDVVLGSGAVRYEIKAQPGLIVGYKTGDIGNVKQVSIWVNPENTDMLMDRFIGKSISARIRYLGSNKDDDGNVLEDTIAEALRRTVGPPGHVKIGTVLVTEFGQPKGQEPRPTNLPRCDRRSSPGRRHEGKSGQVGSMHPVASGKSGTRKQKAVENSI